MRNPFDPNPSTKDFHEKAYSAFVCSSDAIDSVIRISDATDSAVKLELSRQALTAVLRAYDAATESQRAARIALELVKRNHEKLLKA